MRNKSIDNSAQNNLVIHNYGDEVKKGSLKVIGTGNTTSMMKVQTGLNYILGNTPTSNIDTQFLTMDSNGDWTGIFSNTVKTNGSVVQMMACRKQDKSTSAAIQVGYDQNGNAYTYAPASSIANSIVTTTGVSKSANGYVKLGNGLIIQWGVVSITSYNQTGTITLPTPFTSTNYSVGSTGRRSEGNGQGQLSITSTKSTTAFTYRSDAGQNYFNMQQFWVAIGY